jgi:Na+/proline symporter
MPAAGSVGAVFALLWAARLGGAAGWGLKAKPWPDHFRRHNHRPGDGSAQKIREAEEERRRRLMDVKDPDTGEPYAPRADGKAVVNGVEMDYKDFDCPWVDSLDVDYPALCVPYQNALNPVNHTLFPNVYPEDRDASFPHASLNCAADVETASTKHWLPSTCAANAPGEESPVCKTYIKDCKYSTKDTRKCDSEKCKEVRSITTTSDPLYQPEELRFPLPDAYPNAEGECTEEDASMQWLACGIPCPLPFPREKMNDTFTALGIAVMAFLGLSTIIGLAMLFIVRGDHRNFFVAGRSLPLYVVVATLGSQCFDSSSALGNLDLGYTYHWWDGGAFPIGLGISLLLNGIFFAKPLNEMKLLTLPDVFHYKFGPATEVVASIVTIISFLFLLAGNLVGCGKIVSFLFDMDDVIGIMISTALIWAYSAAGGLISVAYTDVAQAAIGWTGFIVGTIWIQHNMPNYAGVSPALPLGDKPVFWEGMSDPDSYDPIPNAITLNWATIIVLALGNLMALDFQARCMAAKSPNVARAGCIIAGLIAGTIGVVNTFNAGTTRALYGPSSPHAEFVVNSCSSDITVVGCFGVNCNAIPVPGVGTCGEWKPDPQATLKMLTCSHDDCHPFLDLDGSAGYSPGTEANYPINKFIGGWMLMGIIAASMSTADGAIVAMGTVFSHNLIRKFGGALSRDTNLLLLARLSTLLWAAVACAIATTKPNETGYFLLVAFDCVLAGGVVPLFAAVYWKGCKPIAAFAAIVVGSVVRGVLEYTLPKDGLLLLAGSFARSFGPGVIYDPKLADAVLVDGKIADTCPQEKLEDWTGVDSLVSPVVSLVVLLLVHFLPIPNPSGKWFQPNETISESAAAEEAAEGDDGEDKVESI